MDESTRAIKGVTGYNGTLKGLFNWGAVCLSFIKDIIEKIYKVKAPNTDRIIISAVLPVHKMSTPKQALINNALAGV